jgi:hypothetical protein
MELHYLSLWGSTPLVITNYMQVHIKTNKNNKLYAKTYKLKKQIIMKAIIKLKKKSKR